MLVDFVSATKSILHCILSPSVTKAAHGITHINKASGLPWFAPRTVQPPFVTLLTLWCESFNADQVFQEGEQKLALPQMLLEYFHGSNEKAHSPWILNNLVGVSLIFFFPPLVGQPCKKVHTIAANELTVPTQHTYIVYIVTEAIEMNLGVGPT